MPCKQHGHCCLTLSLSASAGNVLHTRHNRRFMSHVTVCPFWPIRVEASESAGRKVWPTYMDAAIVHVELIPAETYDTM